jgi:malonate-semialdehyde dehydrogenase (acetylating)/methylmalonate-semialdehyde dehydrogenase
MIGSRIGGRLVSDADRTGPVYNPSTGEQTGTVAFAGEALVDGAVTAAAAAFPAWRDTSLVRRQQILFDYRALLRGHTDDLARIVTREHGKTLDDARGEVGRGIEVVEYACGLPELLKGEFSEQVSGGVDLHSTRQPLGVCAGITPFNFPVMVPLWMFPMAIAMGNAFVLKPSERDPSASLLLAELFAEAGLPDGVLNVVQGDRVAVEALLAHPGISAVSFVGSTAVARHIYSTAARNGKRVQALGGAKNHMVVLPDADLEAAADAAVSAGYGSAGERCMAVSVVVAVGEAGDALVGLLKERIGGLCIGDGMEPGTDMGPLITAQHRDRVAGYVERGVEEGAELVVDGRELRPDSQGFFLGPTLLDRVTPGMDVYRDEIFGPVLSVLRAADLDEALALVNGNPYGNGAAIFTSSGASARQFQRDVTAGMIGVNIPIPVPLSFYSFGGWKDSLFGASSIYGPEGVTFYTRPKVVTSRWPKPARAGLDLGFSSQDTR